MNIQFRIAKLERLLTDVSLRRERVRVAVSGKTDRSTAVAGWDRLERDFRAALISLQRQRDGDELFQRG